MSNTTIQLKKSGQTGNTPADLNYGEVAINYADGKLFYKNGVGIKAIENQKTFSTINANNSLIIATTPTDILSLVAGSNIVIDSNTTSKTVTINSTSDDTVAFAAYAQANNASGNTVALQAVNDTQNTNITSVNTFTQAAYNKANNALANTAGAIFGGDLLIGAGGKLNVLTVGGDEGGEILLGKAVSNTTLNGTGVTIDVYQNRLRFFEQGGSARGFYLDISTGGGGATTNIMSGGGGGGGDDTVAFAAYAQANNASGNTVALQSQMTTTNTNITSVNTLATAAYDAANTAASNTVYLQTINDNQNTSISAIDILATAAYGKANAEGDINNTQNTWISDVNTYAAMASFTANAAWIGANTANGNISALQAQMSTTNTDISSVNTLATAAYGKANAEGEINNTQNTWITNTNTLAQSAYDHSNTRFSSSGGTISGNVTIQNDLSVLGNVTFVGNVTSIQVTGNSGQFFGYASNGFNALYAGIPIGYDFQPQTIFQASANEDGYAQINIQNINTGPNASSDLVATADNGTENDTYVSVGIGSSSHSDPDYTLIGPNDGYLYVSGNTTTTGGDLVIGTFLPQNDVIFAAGGMNTENEQMRIIGSTNTISILSNVDSSLVKSILLGPVGNVHITGGSSGQLLSTDGAGNLSFINSPVDLATAAYAAANTAQATPNVRGIRTNASYFPVFVDSNNAVAGAESLYSTGAGITFNPSTNTISATTVSGTSISGSSISGSTGSFLLYVSLSGDNDYVEWGANNDARIMYNGTQNTINLQMRYDATSFDIDYFNGITNANKFAFYRANGDFQIYDGGIVFSDGTKQNTETLSIASAAYEKANGAVQTGFTTISANSVSITPASNADTLTITPGTGVTISACNATKTITINSTGGGGTTSLLTDVRSFTATSGQTIFTVPNYDIGSNRIRVFINGVRQNNVVDYTETNSTTVTLIPGAVAGDNVVFEVTTFDGTLTPTQNTWINNTDTLAKAAFDAANTAQATPNVRGISSSGTYYPIFVDSNNAVATAESLYTDGGLSYDPATNFLTLSNGFLIGSISGTTGSFSSYVQVTGDNDYVAWGANTDARMMYNGTANTINLQMQFDATSFDIDYFNGVTSANKFAFYRANGDFQIYDGGIVFRDGTKQNTETLTIASSAFASANAGVTLATAAYAQANNASGNTVALQAVNNTQNTNITSVNTFADAAFDSANAAIALATAAYGEANAESAINNTQNTWITNVNTFAQAAYNQANTGGGVTTSGIQTNASYFPIFVNANNATATAESLYSHGNLSYNPSTGGLSTNLNGGSILGNFTIGNASSPNTNYFQFGDNTGWTFRFMTSVSGTPTTRFSFVDNGNFTAVGSVTANSDERYKSNWRPVTSKFVEKLSGVRSGVYDRNDQVLTQVGVSAQSLQKILPEAVLENEEGILSVAYGNAALVACVELAKEITKLKEEIADLKEKLNNK